MIYAEAATTAAASPAGVRDVVCDLEQHKLADAKIRTVIDTQVYGEEAVMRFRSKLRGLPVPAVRQRVVRSGDGHGDITSVLSWQDRLVSFPGSGGCAPLAEGGVAAAADRLARLVSRLRRGRGSQ